MAQREEYGQRGGEAIQRKKKGVVLGKQRLPKLGWYISTLFEKCIHTIKSNETARNQSFMDTHRLLPAWR